MRRRPPRSTQSRSSAASDVYKRQAQLEDQFGDAGRLLALGHHQHDARRDSPVSYTHLRAHETRHDLVCRLLLEKKKKKKKEKIQQKKNKKKTFKKKQ